MAVSEEANTSIEVIETSVNDDAATPHRAGTPGHSCRRTIQVGNYRRISFDEKTIQRSNRSRRMNRISSLRSRQKRADLASSAKSTELIAASLNRLTGDGVGHQYSSSYSQEEEEGCVVINEVREYHQQQQQQQQRGSTVGSGNHSSIFEDDAAPSRVNSAKKEKDDGSNKEMVQGGYSPHKATLGLELVASPSLLQQVLTPDSLNNKYTIGSGGESSVGGSTLSSTRSFYRKMERAKRFERTKTSFVGNSIDEEIGGSKNENQADNNDDDDDESAYSAMPTVADDATVGTTKSARSKRVICKSSRAAMYRDQEEVQPSNAVLAKAALTGTSAAAAAAAAAAAKSRDESVSTTTSSTTMSHSKPLPLTPTYSMRSVKTSEGMEVGQFFHANHLSSLDDDNGNDSNANSKTDDHESSENATQPFDETDAKIIASSKQTASSQIRPMSCLRPSSFGIATTTTTNPSASSTKTAAGGGHKHLISPALVQNNRLSSNRSARIAKFRNTFDKHRNNRNNGNAERNTTTMGEGTITQMEQQNGIEESNLWVSNPVVCFADGGEECEAKNTRKTTEESKAKSTSKTVASTIAREESKNTTTKANEIEKTADGKQPASGHPSPTSVNEFFSDDNPTTAQQQQEEEDSHSVNSHSTTSSIDKNSSITNRLARNRQALKSMALAKKSSVKNRKKAKKVNEDGGTNHTVVSPADQEGNTPSIVQSVSDLCFPQFTPALLVEDGIQTKSEEGAYDTEIAAMTTTKTASVTATKTLDSSREEVEEEEDLNSPSIEIDASILLNTSNESTSPRKKRFLLPRIRRRNNVVSTPKTSNKSSSNDEKSSGHKRSIKSKLFGKKREERTTPTKSTEELAKIEEVEKYTAWLAPTTQPAADSEDEFPMDELPTKSETKQEEPCSSGSVNKFPSSSTPSTASAVAATAAAAAATTTAVAVAKGNDDEPSVTGIESSEAGPITEMDPTFMMEEDTHKSSIGKQLPFFGMRARSSSSKNSKSSLNSKSSINSKSSSLTKQESEPELSARERSTMSDDGAPLSGNDTRVPSSSGDYADFGAVSRQEASVPVVQDTATIAKNWSFEEEMANAQIDQMFPDFSNAHFVGEDVSGEVEHGVEVKWGVQILEPNEFGHEGIALDTTAVIAELKQSLSEAKWDNDTKIGDDISWPSEVVSQKTPAIKSDVDETPLKILADSANSSPESKFQGVEEASTKSGGTKTSSLYPRKLFIRRSKDRREQNQKVTEEEEESVSDFQRFESEKKRSPHPAEKRNMRCSAGGKDDSRSIDEDSDDYSSDEYSSDEREDLVGAIATSLNKGFTGIVDMMETAFAFNKVHEEVDYSSESSESEEEEDDYSYVQRKMARRRDKQRRLLREARRNSRRQQHERKRRSKSTSRHSRTPPDNESIISEEENQQRRHRHEMYVRKASSGRVMSRRRVESPRYEY